MRALVASGTSMSNPNGHSGFRKLTAELTTTSPVRSISSLPELICTEMWPSVGFRERCRQEIGLLLVVTFDHDPVAGLDDRFEQFDGSIRWTDF
jgi:hypothetical protein